MISGDFVRRSGLFSYDALKCLRNAYRFNSCSLCIDICPENAFHIAQNKLVLSDDSCIDCAACIGSCPTEALAFDGFDPNVYAVRFKESKEEEVSCKKGIPCLGVFDVHHYVVMALYSPETPVCDMAYCSGCRLNGKGTVESAIRKRISIANDFLASVGSEKSIGTNEEEQRPNGRRELFRKVFDTAAGRFAADIDAAAAAIMDVKHVDINTPLKLLLLKSAVKESLGSFKSTLLKDGGGLFFNKAISFEACSNCGDCIRFCPTKALTATSDSQGILFTQAKCIGCGICDHVCKADAIGGKEDFDLTKIAYSQTRKLVYYEMAVCSECHCPYHYKGGETICERCAGFKVEFGDMFVLAKDM